MLPFPVTVHGAVWKFGGFGNVARELAVALHNAGHATYVLPIGEDEGHRVAHRDLIKTLVSPRAYEDPHELTITCLPPPATPLDSAHRFLYTTVEPLVADRLYALRCLPDHHTILPSESNVSALIAAGLPAPRLHLIPYGYRPELRGPLARPPSILGLKRPLVLIVGAFSKRKCSTEIIKSWIRTHNTRHEGTLLYLANHGPSDGKDHLAEILTVLHRQGVTQQDLATANVIIRTDWIPDLQLYSYYQHCDYFLSMSRGEGFNLPLFEAVIAGAVPIWHAAHAHLQFLNAHVPIAISSNGTSTPFISNLEAPDQYVNQPFAEPDWQQLDHVLSGLLLPTPPVRARVAQARNLLLGWTWARTARLFALTINRILQTPDVKLTTMQYLNLRRHRRRP